MFLGYVLDVDEDVESLNEGEHDAAKQAHIKSMKIHMMEYMSKWANH